MQEFIGGVEDQEYLNAGNLIAQAQEKGNRVHITGIGKPGHVAAYGASLLSSTGTPTYFLHGTEAV
ncbi:MAG: carbohydrate isomerase, partial [Oscillospiraceae bacterium]